MTDRAESAAPFGSVDWALLGTLSIVWGSSYLLIDIGLDTLAPGVVALGRVALGALVLALIPAARTAIDRRDWPKVGIVAVFGNAGPALLFAVSEQTVESAVVGLITAATPILTMLLALALGSRNLRWFHFAGLGLGFVGLGLMAGPNLSGADAPAAGIAMAIAAVSGYAVSNNTIVPLQRRYGGTAVIARALTVSTVLLLPFGLVGLGDSTWGTPSVVAVVVLGVGGTGLARMMAANLIGRAGATRASTIGYTIPVVAVTLGVLFRGDTVGVIELMGLGCALVGAFLVTRPAAVVRRPG